MTGDSVSVTGSTKRAIDKPVAIVSLTVSRGCRSACVTVPNAEPRFRLENSNSCDQS